MMMAKTLQEQEVNQKRKGQMRWHLSIPVTSRVRRTWYLDGREAVPLFRE